eukprot:8807281-Alexandrium_andersonii.AAC.1
MGCAAPAALRHLQAVLHLQPLFLHALVRGSCLGSAAFASGELLSQPRFVACLLMVLRWCGAQLASCTPPVLGTIRG